MLDDHDKQRLGNALDQAERIAAEGFSSCVADDAYADELGGDLAFDHVAILVFPDSFEDVQDFLADAGLDVNAPVPSVVVRERLARRYGVSEHDLDVTIVRGHSTTRTRWGIEVFVLPQAIAARIEPSLVARERVTEAEAHVAWMVAGERLEKVRRVCEEGLAMRPDGSGYNPHEDSASGGRTVLYFRVQADRSGSTSAGRLELTSEGHHPDALAAHAATLQPPQEHTTLLSILAGHWAARALHATVEIGLVDVLNEQPLRASTVAARTNCDPAATGRLLRYLDDLGVVRRREDETYLTTELGDLLRTDNPFCELIRLYGGEFYDAWSEFPAAVRTGRTAFSHRYGVEHFEYFADHPAIARRFDHSMQAITELVADEVSRAYPFSDGAKLIDVGAGNGTLLRGILRDHATLSGIAFDRAHVSRNGMVDEDGGGVGDRLRAVVGDFFVDVPTGGDVYLLSRVLHDWSDEACHRILANCRRAAAAGATLLVLERLLPGEIGDPRRGGLAAPWDMQMLAVTGGRERTRAEYEKLLHGNGFLTSDVRPLPVDMNLLVATAA